MKAREPRTNVVLPVRIRWNGRWISATARNLSPHGLMLSTTTPPPPGTYVEVHLLSHVVTARSIWAEGLLCGFHTRERLDVARLAAPGGARDEAAVIAPAFGKRPPRAAASVALQGELSQQFGKAMQYATLVALSVAAAGSLGWEVYRTLEAPMSAVGASLGGGS